MYSLFSGCRPGKNDQLRMLGNFGMPQQPMGCTHLVTCRACAQKSGYTSSISVCIYSVPRVTTRPRHNVRRPAQRKSNIPKHPTTFVTLKLKRFRYRVFTKKRITEPTNPILSCYESLVIFMWPFNKVKKQWMVTFGTVKKVTKRVSNIFTLWNF